LTLPADITLYFVRHGETDWNRLQRYQGQTDIPLNDTGRDQARRNGRMLAVHLGAAAGDLDYVASPLSRTTETMQIVRAELGLDPHAFRRDDRLKEQHFGHWEGQLWSELPSLDPVGFAARKADPWHWMPQGGENYDMVVARIVPWLATLRRDTVVVSHGNISRTLRHLLLGHERSAAPKLEVPQDRVLRIKAGVGEWI
jgi:probable phosphoglycerate mutase